MGKLKVKKPFYQFIVEDMKKAFLLLQMYTGVSA